MIGNNFLLDTNIIVAWLNGESLIANKVDEVTAIYLPIIVVGELYYGAMFSKQVQKNRDQIRELVERYSVLLVDEETALEYGRIKSVLRRKGRPIPENDIWIAAIALQYNLPLVTRDKHFTEIDGLMSDVW